MASSIGLVETKSARKTGKRKFKYELYFPESEHYKNEQLPLIIVLHGFGGSTSGHTQFAKSLARLGSIVLIPQMSLAAVLKKSRHNLRQANIEGIVDLAGWLIHRGEDPKDDLHSRIKADTVAVVGHSAGGAVAFEAACLMQAAGTRPRALLLLDGVPWVSTINRARNNELSYSASKQLVMDGSACNLCSLRASRAPANANGLFYPTLAESSRSFLDIEFPGAKHGDFADGAWKSCLIRLIGLATTEETYDDIMRVCFAFLGSVLELKGDVTISGLQGKDTASLYTSVLESPQNFTLEEVDSATVEKTNIKKLPAYLQ